MRASSAAIMPPASSTRISALGPLPKVSGSDFISNSRIVSSSPPRTAASSMITTLPCTTSVTGAESGAGRDSGCSDWASSENSGAF